MKVIIFKSTGYQQLDSNKFFLNIWVSNSLDIDYIYKHYLNKIVWN